MEQELREIKKELGELKLKTNTLIFESKTPPDLTNIAGECSPTLKKDVNYKSSVITNLPLTVFAKDGYVENIGSEDPLKKTTVIFKDKIFLFLSTGKAIVINQKTNLAEQVNFTGGTLIGIDEEEEILFFQKNSTTVLITEADGSFSTIREITVTKNCDYINKHLIEKIDDTNFTGTVLNVNYYSITGIKKTLNLDFNVLRPMIYKDGIIINRWDAEQFKTRVQSIYLDEEGNLKYLFLFKDCMLHQYQVIKVSNSTDNNTRLALINEFGADKSNNFASEYIYCSHSNFDGDIWWFDYVQNKKFRIYPDESCPYVCRCINKPCLVMFFPCEGDYDFDSNKAKTPTGRTRVFSGKNYPIYSRYNPNPTGCNMIVASINEELLKDKPNNKQLSIRNNVVRISGEDSQFVDNLGVNTSLLVPSIDDSRVINLVLHTTAPNITLSLKTEGGTLLRDIAIAEAGYKNIKLISFKGKWLIEENTLVELG